MKRKNFIGVLAIVYVILQVMIIDRNIWKTFTEVMELSGVKESGFYYHVKQNHIRKQPLGKHSLYHVEDILKLKNKFKRQW